MKVQEVEGGWSDYEFQIAQLEDHPRISQFLSENYYKDEPITLLLGWTPEKARDMDAVVKEFLDDRLSIIALHKESQEVVAVRIAYDSRRKVNLTKTFHSEANLKVQIAKDQLLKMAEHCLKSKYPEEVYGMGFLSSVSTNHRGKGLASEIYIRSILYLQQRGFKVARNYFSSKITMKIVQRLGYEELSRVYLGKLKDDEGNLVFPDADEDFYATFMARRLDNEIN